MSDRLQELAVFVRSAESGSFSRAARDLGLSQPSVSRLVAALEARLGARLLLRTTRRVVPTDAGAVFLERARRLLLDLEEAEEAARGADSLRGSLRVALPGAFGVREVIPLLPAFLGAHPRLKVELILSDRAEDLVGEGVDMAVRLGRLADSGFGSRHLATAPRLAVAAPAYLAARGAPATPAALAGHDCILGPGALGRQGWSFIRGGAVTSVSVEARIQASSAEGALACARVGLGIALASLWLCRVELGAGALVPVLDGFALEPVDVHALFPAGRRPSAKVRAFTDHLAASLAG